MRSSVNCASGVMTIGATASERDVGGRSRLVDFGEAVGSRLVADTRSRRGPNNASPRGAGRRARGTGLGRECGRCRGCGRGERCGRCKGCRALGDFHWILAPAAREHCDDDHQHRSSRQQDERTAAPERVPPLGPRRPGTRGPLDSRQDATAQPRTRLDRIRSLTARSIASSMARRAKGRCYSFEYPPAASFRLSTRRASATRHFTVPTGVSSITEISSYVCSPDPASSSASRSLRGSVPISFRIGPAAPRPRAERPGRARVRARVHQVELLVAGLVSRWRRRELQPPADALASVNGLPPGDRQQPRPELRIATKSGQLAPRGHERLLRDIVRLGWRTRPPRAPRERRRAGSVDKFAERIKIARLSQAHEVEIRRVGGSLPGAGHGHTICRLSHLGGRLGKRSNGLEDLGTQGPRDCRDPRTKIRRC